MSKIKLAMWAVVALMLVTGAGAQSYTITDLGVLPGDDLSFPYAMNDQGAVVGFSELRAAQNDHAFLWTAASGMQDLGTLPGDTISVAYSINNSGEIVGTSASSTEEHAFIWTANGGMQPLFSSPGIAAVAINDSGQIVGSFSTSGGLDEHAYLWTRTQGIRDLGSLGGSSYAVAINAAGEVIGDSDILKDGLSVHGFLWTEAGGMQDLGTLPGGADSQATVINQFGQIFGVSNTSKRGDYQGAFWTESGGWRSLNFGSDSVIRGVNGSGELVGCSLYCARAELWTPGDQGQLLDHLIPANSGWLLYDAYAINKSGQIAVYGTVTGAAAAHAALLTPTN